MSSTVSSPAQVKSHKAGKKIPFPLCPCLGFSLFTILTQPFAFFSPFFHPCLSPSCCFFFAVSPPLPFPVIHSPPHSPHPPGQTCCSDLYLSGTAESQVRFKTAQLFSWIMMPCSETLAGVYRGQIKSTFTWVPLSPRVAPASGRATVGVPEHTETLRPPPLLPCCAFRYVIVEIWRAETEPKFTVTINTALFAEFSYKMLGFLTGWKKKRNKKKWLL